MIHNNRISFYEIEETTSCFGLKSVCKHLYWVTECDKCREDMKKPIANNGTEFGEIIRQNQKFTLDSKDAFDFNDQNQSELQNGDHDDLEEYQTKWEIGRTKDDKKRDEVTNDEETVYNLETISVKELKVCSTPILNTSGSQSKKRGRKRENEGLHKRKFVIQRSMLRRIKKYYWNKINNTVGYKRQKKLCGVEIYENYLKYFIENEFQEKATNEFIFILGCITSPSDMKELIVHKINTQSEDDDELHEKLAIANKMHQVLLNFSIAKFKSLARCPEFFKIISNFQLKVGSLTSDGAKGVQFLLKACTRPKN